MLDCLGTNPLGTGRPWIALVTAVKLGEPTALEELYAGLALWIRPYLIRSLGPERVNDHVQDVYLAVVQQIQEGGLQNEAALVPFVRAVVDDIAVALITRGRHQPPNQRVAPES